MKTQKKIAIETVRAHFFPALIQRGFEEIPAHAERGAGLFDVRRFHDAGIDFVTVWFQGGPNDPCYNVTLGHVAHRGPCRVHNVVVHERALLGRQAEHLAWVRSPGSWFRPTTWGPRGWKRFPDSLMPGIQTLVDWIPDFEDWFKHPEQPSKKLNLGLKKSPSSTGWNYRLPADTPLDTLDDRPQDLSVSEFEEITQIR